MHADQLINFNFPGYKDTHEVNWYLHHFVGCKVPSPMGWNWTFKEAIPGIIYIPFDWHNMDAEVITGKKTRSPLALEFEEASDTLGTLSKVNDVYGLIDMGLSVAGIEFFGALGAVMTLAGVVSAAASLVFLLRELGIGAFESAKKRLALEGFSIGVVLAADDRSMSWIIQHNGYSNFIKTGPVLVDAQLKEYDRKLAVIYNEAFKEGYAHGKEFNTVATVNLFRFVQSKIPSESTKKEFSGDPKTWSDTKWVTWYRMAAASLRQLLN
jgi:hypothetical protein